MDLSALSDEQLNALEKAHTNPLSSLSDDELNALEKAHSISIRPVSPAEVSADVAKSAAIGPVKAAVGMAGAIPGIAGAAKSAANQYLFDPLFNAISGPPKEPQPAVPSRLTQIGGPQPTDINKAIGSGLDYVQGQLYQPKTPPGRYAQSITEAGTGAALGPGGLAMKAAQGLGTGIGSEFASSQAPDWLKPYAGFLGGVVGGVGAAGGTQAVQGIRNASAAAGAGQDISKVIGGGPIKIGAVRRVGQNLSDEELTPAAASAKMQTLGPQGMLLDLGQQLENRADFMAQHAGKAQNTIYNPLAERAQGIAPQLNAVLDKHMGPSQNVVALQNGIEDWSRKNVTPLYKALEEKYPVVNDRVMQEISQRPAIQQAMKNAGTIAKDMGETLSVPETKTILKGPGYHIAEDVQQAAQPSIRYWDFVKKSLDQRINGMAKGAEESSATQSTMAAVMKARRDLVNHLDNVTGGAYAQARKLAATKHDMEEAVDLGRSIFTSKMLPEQLAEHLDGMSLAERKMVEIGVRREIENRVGTAGDEGRKLRALIGAPNNSAKLENLLGKQANTEIQNEVMAADQFQRVKNKIEGTRTATRTAGMADTTAPQVNLGVTATGLAGAAPSALVNKLLEHGFANTRQDISRILTAKGGQVNPVVQMLLKYNEQKAANAATPLGQQAAALARALISQGVSR